MRRGEVKGHFWQRTKKKRQEEDVLTRRFHLKINATSRWKDFLSCLGLHITKSLPKKWKAQTERGKTFHLDANAHFLLYPPPLPLIPALDGAGGFGSGAERRGRGWGWIKQRTDEFRQAAPRPELEVG